MRFVVPGLSLTIAIIGLAGCGWASRNVYQEPETGDAGSVTIVNAAPAFRSNIWIYNGQGADGKAIAVYDAAPERSVKVLHGDAIVLRLELAAAGPTATGFSAESCSRTVEVPFSSGDLRVTLKVSADRCAFDLEQRDAAHPWKALDEVREWKGALRSHA